MRPLRILHVTPYGENAWAYGGIARVASTCARQLAALGHDVTVCTTDAGDATHRVADPGPHGDRITVRVFPNRSNRLAHDWQMFTPIGLHAWLREHARDFDIAHLHACRNLPGAIAAHHLRRYHVPYVLAPNGTAPVIERRRAAKHVFDALAGRRMFHDAAAVLAVSDAERRDLEALGIARDRIYSVPNPIDATEFSPPVTTGCFRRRAGVPSDPLVVFLGKITPRKRLDILIRAFGALGSRAAHARLVIAGNDMGGLDNARALAQTIGISDRVIVTGLLVGRERLELLADATVVVYPSEHEIFGLVPLEAIVSGSPVIVTSDSGCGEIVSGTGGGTIVPAGDVAALAGALGEMLEHRARWRADAREAGADVLRRYGAGTVTDRLVEVYRNVIGPAKAAACPPTTGVSFVMPVRNGLTTIAGAIESIEQQAVDRPLEIIAVDDRSTDGSAEWLSDAAAAGRLRVLAGGGRGPSAAMNLGIREAQHPVICQIDQDVMLLPGWLERVLATLESDELIGAVQGQYTTDTGAPLLARVMGLDLEQRYVALERGVTSHVCTGNTAYRASALRDAGLFDESLGYGNDNDMSYRLSQRGWRLVHCPQARSTHRWREGFAAYLIQQFGLGYGRLEVVARHPHQITGDSVSPSQMMLHPALMLTAIAGLALGGVMSIAGLVIVMALAMERAAAGVRAWWRFSDRAPLLFPVVHLARDLAWVAAIVTWTVRRLLGRRSDPSHSMLPRQPGTHARVAPTFIPRATRVLAIVPAHNEAATLASVVADVRRECPGLELLVVDDGSSDRTADLLPRLGVRWLQMPERMGVGAAMRAGLRYARRLGFDSVVRLDGDGQHCARDIASMIQALHDGRADVVLGSRFVGAHSRHRDRRLVHRLLGRCLSWLTRRSVTDPTCGFCALGPRALRIMAEHHPTGYPEAELRLVADRHRLVSIEVAVESRARMGGRTSLTPARLFGAAARVLLAMLIVPLRRATSAADHE